MVELKDNNSILIYKQIKNKETFTIKNGGMVIAESFNDFFRLSEVLSQPVNLFNKLKRLLCLTDFF